LAQAGCPGGSAIRSESNNDKNNKLTGWNNIYEITTS